jgi:hypothetical protein
MPGARSSAARVASGVTSVGAKPVLPDVRISSQLALSTIAEVTPLAEEAASGLSAHDGVAAMLRY